MLPLETQRLLIRELALQDFEAVHRYGSDPVVTRYVSFGPNSEADTRGFLERVMQNAAESPRRCFELGVVLRESGELIGSCGLLGQRLQYREYEVGYCFHQDAWGRGIATESVRALVTFGFRELGAHRLFAQVHPDNRASSHVLERLGFRLEGRQKSAMLIQGVWSDMLLYALLDEEWT